MTFPLPTGICRKVCRPVRPTPRVTRTPDVVRMALAAVKHGALPCEVSGAVRVAVGCELCIDEINRILETWDALQEVIFDIMELLRRLKDEFDIIPGLPSEGIKRWVWLLIRRLNLFARLYRFATIVFELIDTLGVLFKILSMLLDDVKAFLDCAKRQFGLED
jgi:hypothetical protein